MVSFHAYAPDKTQISGCLQHCDINSPLIWHRMGCSISLIHVQTNVYIFFFFVCHNFLKNTHKNIAYLASSHSAECVDESQLDSQISHRIHILVTFLYHLGNSLINKE